jgi:Recombinase/Bacterial regulatory protein, Fis family
MHQGAETSHVRVRLYGMSHRRQQRRADKAHRHVQPTQQPRNPVARSLPAAPPRVVVREASHVERLAYTRSHAAEALGISRSTLRRLLPYIETIEMPWGAKLIPVDELERITAERRRMARPRLAPATRGRRLAVPPEIAERIHHDRSSGKSLRQIAADLNAERVPTAHGGEEWWPSTVRAILVRACAPASQR